MKMKCARCSDKLLHEVHSSMYDEPPFYCSESCYGNYGILKRTYWKIIKLLKYIGKS